MFIDKDSWGKFTIRDLSEKDIHLLYEALKVYVRQNPGCIHRKDNERGMVFGYEYKSIMNNE